MVLILWSPENLPLGGVVLEFNDNGVIRTDCTQLIIFRIYWALAFQRFGRHGLFPIMAQG